MDPSDNNRVAPLILASASPRRRELLSRVGIPLTVKVSGIDEVSVLEGRTPAELALHNAELKAKDVATRVSAGSLVLSADTIVVVGARVLGKPTSEAEAMAMLRALSGLTHQVVTAFILLKAGGGARVAKTIRTDVTFNNLCDAELEGYVGTGEPMDKAGGYGIQGIGTFLVTKIQGSYTNVVGLPLSEVLDALRRLGGPVPFSTPRGPSESG